MFPIIGLYNDPAAGSPTATLLRLSYPLNGRVWPSFRLFSRPKAAKRINQRASLDRSIGYGDGRCAQGAGT